MKALILTILSLTFTVVDTEPNGSNIDYEKRYEILQRRVAGLQEELNEVKKENKRLRILCKKNGIEVNDQENEKSESIGISEEFQMPLEVEQIAYLGKNQHVHIQQVIDKDNIIAKLTLGYSPIYSRSAMRDPGLLTTVPISGYKAITRIVWIRGIDTSNWVDGNEIKVFAPLKIVGTKTYETVDEGTKTVFLLEPYIASRSD